MAKKKKLEARAEVMDFDQLKAFLKKNTKGISIETANERYDKEGDVEPLPTGNPWLDLFTGIGGLPKGKIIEFSGEEGVSKSALNQMVAGVIQHSGVIKPFRKNYTEEQLLENAGNVVWIDAERAMDLRIPKQRKHFTERLGMDPDRLILVQPDTIEQGLDLINACILSGSVAFIVYDSIVASSTADEYDKDNDEGSWNKLPQVLNRGLRAIAPNLSRTDCTLVLLNQLRQNLNKKSKYDEEWVTTGGKGLKHWCSVRIQLFKSTKLKGGADGKLNIGHKVRVRVAKTRLDINHGDAYLYWYHDRGFDYGEELFNLALEWDIIYKPANGWYNFNIEDELLDDITNMREKEIIELLNEDEDIYKRVNELVVDSFNEYNDGEIDDDLEDQDEDDDDEDEEEDEE